MTRALTLPEMLKEDYCKHLRYYIENVLHLSIEEAGFYRMDSYYDTIDKGDGYLYKTLLGTNVTIEFKGKGDVTFSLDEARDLYLRKQVLRFMRKRLKELRSSK